MKIAVFEVNPTPESITNVDSVTVQKVADDCEIMINTRDKWVAFEYKGGSYNQEARELLDAHPDHISIVLDKNEFPEVPFVDNSEPDGHHYTEVIIFAENKEEAELINGIRYVSQDKDQIIYMIQPPKIKEAITLADYTSPSLNRPTP